MNIDPESLARLRELAEKATPGPWFPKQLSSRDRTQLLAALNENWLRQDDDPERREYFFVTNDAGEAGVSTGHTGNGPTSEWNARFISAFNPAAVLALLDEVERLRSCLDSAGMQCFMRDGKPEEVAAHMQSVAASHLAEVERLRAENEKLRAKLDERKAVLAQHERCADAFVGADRPASCEYCDSQAPNGHLDYCAWQRAMEDV